MPRKLLERLWIPCALVVLLLAAAPPAPAAQPAEEMRLLPVGQIGGAVDAVELAGGYAFVGIGPRVRVLDVSDPTLPEVIGESAVLPGRVRDLRFRGDYVYAAYAAWRAPDPIGSEAPAPAGGLAVLNVADRARPQTVAVLPGGGPGHAIALDGERLYLGQGHGADGALSIISVADPTAPARLGALELDGSVLRVALSDGRVYALQGDVVGARLREVDVSDPARPQDVASVKITAGSEGPPNSAWLGLAVTGGLAYAAGTGTGLHVVDISESGELDDLGAVTLPEQVVCLRAMAVADQALWLADPCGGALHVLGLGAPQTPAYQLTRAVDGRPADLAIDEARVAAAGGTAGGMTLAAADAADPQVLGRHATLGPVDAVEAAGQRVFTADRDRTLNALTWDGETFETGTRVDGRGETINFQMLVEGDVLYVLHHAREGPARSTLLSYDVAEPRTLKEQGELRLEQRAAGGIGVDDDLMVAGYGTNGLNTVDVGTPSRMRILGGGLAIWASWPVIDGSRAFVAGRRRLHELDLRTASRPEIANTNQDPSGTGKLTWRDDHIYMGRTEGFDPQTAGFDVFDVSRVGRSEMTAEYRGWIGDRPDDVTHIGSHVLTVDELALRAIDVSTPDTPALAVERGLAGQGMDLSVSDGHIYAAEGDAGLSIWRLVPADEVPTATATPEPPATATVTPGGPTATPVPTETPEPGTATPSAVPAEGDVHLPLLFNMYAR